ncbi:MULTISPECIES: carbon-nitrogen hydrolase family protein [unclassified Mycobacterium]|uniref:carbon-nitrogen hydrolase family protein n=1 Tax=unclassified Mycobacterium TaxID=2642494 RepID=UPI00048E9DBE|nr:MULTISPECIES: carbon-nitrogen hydrolase family protein [unclassified Mycobacterium]SEB20164.1 Predicted amidohydrolase [Mycobacterium sp. 283mftsu]
MITVGMFQGPQESGTVAENLAAIAAAAQQAAAAGCQIVVTPEMSATGYNIGSEIAQRAEPADGPIFQAVSTIAREAGIAVVYGYPEATEGKPYNSVQVVSRDGAALANYRKTHLYGFDRDYFTAGSQWVTQFELDGVTCGLLICYDIEFPENARAHADAGTQWLAVPTGLMEPWSFVATHIVPARAYESQMFVSYVNRTGFENGLEYCGLSCTIAPDTTELSRGGRTEELLITHIDPGAVAVSRAVNTHLGDRRRDLYQENQTR